jgi:CheY-like chemotaxis protein
MEWALARKVMIAKIRRQCRILIVEDVQETRDSIKELLRHDGYCVDSSRDEDEAIEKIHLNHPDLILISLGGTPEYVLSASQRIRFRGGLDENTPVVIFSLATVPDGAEEELAGNVYVTVPDNFNQLRALLTRVVHGAWRTH